MRRFCSVLCLAALPALLSSGPTATAAPVPTTPSGFTVASGANLGAGASSQFVGVVSPAPADAWIGGSYRTGGTAHWQPLLEHWNGSTWTLVHPPLPAGTSDAFINSISETAANNIWIGGFATVSGHDRTLLEHWNGSTWIQVVLPTTLKISYVSSVAAASSTQVWFYGYNTRCNGRNDSFLYEYNVSAGTYAAKYKEDACDAIPDGDVFYATDATSANAGWWLGGLFLHEDDATATEANCYGSACPTRSATIPGNFWGYYSDAIGTPTSTWLIGGAQPADPDSGIPIGWVQPLVSHWNGTGWTDASPSFGYTTTHEFNAGTLLANGTLWAIGERLTTTGSDRTLIEERTAGGAWSDLGGPNVGTGDNYLVGVAHVPGTATAMWAVGSGGGEGLLLHHP